MDIKNLQEVAKAERRLEEMSAMDQIKKIEPFLKELPAIAQILLYLKTYRQPLPENHYIFKILEDLQKSKSSKKESPTEDLGENNQQENEEDSDYGEEPSNEETIEIIDNSIQEMEELNDKLWFFIESRKTELITDYAYRAKLSQIKSYLKNNKVLLKRIGRK